MPELTEKKRDLLKESTFGLPEERKYPIARTRATRPMPRRARAEQLDEGHLTKAEKAKIDRKADQILDKD